MADVDGSMVFYHQDDAVRGELGFSWFDSAATISAAILVGSVIGYLRRNSTSEPCDDRRDGAPRRLPTVD